MSTLENDLTNMTVDEVLKKWPQTAAVFRHYSPACLGCAIAPFCDVAAVADIYGLPKDKFLNDLQVAIQSNAAW
ncbi:MAG: hypothetical protein GY796_07370 [Chloroflexi bacterium]|nr:hypothetical protein [Chloroflexota bacterium]